MTSAKARFIAQRVNEEWGEAVCDWRDVWTVEREGTLPNREAVASRILQEIEEATA